MNKIALTQTIMTEFAVRTGLAPPNVPPCRYLWTDSFAVFNYLELYRQTRSEDYLNTALALVDQVHRVLGRYSDTDPRRGWISGLAEEEGARHPTLGGLRIGKTGNERATDEPLDEYLEWERDGQYFHYLTKWMQALNCIAQVTRQSRYLIWSLELAGKASRAFTYTPISGRARRMYWKMSIDLCRPQVASMGQHDPLDGLITLMQLESSTDRISVPQELHLNEEIEEFRAMCSDRRWATDDALGIGGLLYDAFRLAQLVAKSNMNESGRLALLLRDAESGLEVFLRKNHLQISAPHRLAFRELGLSIGIHAIEGMQKIVEQHSDLFSNSRQLLTSLSELSRFRQFAEKIELFWLRPENQLCDTWTDHQDINSVMLATSLLSKGYPIPR